MRHGSSIMDSEREITDHLARPFKEQQDRLGALNRTCSLVGRQAPANPAPAAPLASYVGSYANPYWGPAHVDERDGALTLSLGPKLRVPLQHWDGNVFTFSFVTENAPPGTISKATFDGGKLTLEYYDQDGTGVFLR